MHTYTQTTTPAREPDLFADPAQGQQPGMVLEFTGTLKADAQVRSKPVGDGGHALPVLCLELEGVGPALQTVRVEQVYPEALLHQAEQRARGLRRHMRVSVTTNPFDLRLFIPHAQQIEVQAPAGH